MAAADDASIFRAGTKSSLNPREIIFNGVHLSLSLEMDHSFSGDRLRLERSLPPKMPSTKEYDISQVEWEGEEAPFPLLLRRRRRRRDKRRRERVEGFLPPMNPFLSTTIGQDVGDYSTR